MKCAVGATSSTAWKEGSNLLAAGKECKELLRKLDAELADLNLYDILEPCYRREGAAKGVQSHVQLGSPRRWPLGGAVVEGAPVQNWAHILGDDAGHPPCLDHR